MSAISNKSSFFSEITFAGLLFLPSLYFASEHYFLLLPIAVCGFYFKEITQLLEVIKRHKIISILIALFILLASLNKVFNGLPITCWKDYYASFLLFPLLIFSAFYLRKVNFGQWFILLVSVEIIVCMLEYFSGVRSFFPVECPPINPKSDFIYDHRVFGLSVNSSVVSYKILAALLLLENQNWKKYSKLILQAFLFLGVIVTFNRALILAVVFMYLLMALYQVWKNKKNIQNSLFALAPLVLFLLVFQSFSKHSILTELNKKNPETKKLSLVKVQALGTSTTIQSCMAAFQPNMKEGNELNQKLPLTKLLLGSTKHINTSGRTLIWANFFQFIEEHLWFGNGSDKLYFREKDIVTGEEKLVHAHNSFLELIATHGLLLSALFIGILLVLWRKKNLIFIMTLLFFSLFQYGVFWGISILDVIFMVFLLSPITLWRNEGQPAY